MPQQPKKKGRGGLIALGVIALVLVCGIGSCAALGGAALFGGGGDKAAIAKAESRYSAAGTYLKDAGASLSGIDSANSAALQAEIAKRQTGLANARQEVAQAKTEIGAIADSVGKRDYIGSLDAADKALNDLQAVWDYAKNMSLLSDKITEAAATSDKANNTLNEAISAGNAHSYSKMKSKAKAASALWAKAASQYRAAAALEPGSGLDKSAKRCDKIKQQADIVVRMAGEGAKNKVGAYNSDIKKENSIRAAAEAIPLPEIVRNPSSLTDKLKTLAESATAAGKEADDLHSKALQELGYSK